MTCALAINGFLDCGITCEGFQVKQADRVGSKVTWNVRVRLVIITNDLTSAEDGMISD